MSYRRNLTLLGLLMLILSISLSFTTVRADEAREGRDDKGDTKEDGSSVIEEGLPIREQLDKMFSQLETRRLPSGILLDSGSVLYHDAVLASNGMSDGGREKAKEAAAIKEATATSAYDFQNMYFDLASAAQNDRSVMSYEQLAETSTAYSEKYEEGIVPLAFAVIDYEAIDAAAFDDGRLQERDGVIAWNADKGDYWNSHTFVAVGSVGKPVIECGQPRFVIPSAMIVTNRGEKAVWSSAEVLFDGADQPITIAPDVPFTDNSYVITGDQQTVRFTLTAEVGRDKVTTTGTVEMRNCKSLPAHCDLDQVTADVPFNGVAGILNIRVYPNSADTEDCEDLNNILVLIDGFDLDNSRTQTSIWNTFGGSIEGFMTLGFDVVVVDYQVGNTFVQRNGQAVRKLMVDVIPTLFADGAESDVVVIGGSMGSQTGRYGLRQAEIAGEDHNTGLFISFDGEFSGANVPIGLQLELKFLAGQSPAAGSFLASLNSPAAKQLLIHHHNWFGGGWYAPDPLFGTYYAEADALGLPTMTRNVSIASGSGTGTLQNDGTKERLSFVDWDGPAWTRFVLDAQTDHPGRVFYGRITKFWSSYSTEYTLGSSAARDDIAPGGFRNSPVQIAQAYNSDPNARGTMTFELGQHNFVPTASAIGTGFDASYHEKCNTEHATATTGNIEVIATELVYYLFGATPPAPPQWTAPCGVAEPTECQQNVQWWDLNFIVPVYDGANCRVSQVPSGATGFTSGQNYYLENAAGCPSGYPFQNNIGCFLTTLPTVPAGYVGYFESGNDASVNIYVNPGWWAPSCPNNTTQTFFDSGTWGAQRVCEVNFPAGYNATTAFSSGGKIYLESSDPCPNGGVLDATGCWMGVAPAGTNPFVWGTSPWFYYAE